MKRIQNLMLVCVATVGMSIQAAPKDESVLAERFRNDSVQVKCSYKMMGVHFIDVAFSIRDGEKLSTSAEITHQGRTHKETLTQVESQPGEMVHGWLSQQSPDNSIELIVYTEPQAEGRSKLINPHIPAGNVMWGDCEGL